MLDLQSELPQASYDHLLNKPQTVKLPAEIHQANPVVTHLFSATSSPSCANFSLRWTAKDNQQEFSKDAVNSVKNNFYVDNSLKSVPSENKAIVLVDKLYQLL